MKKLFATLLLSISLFQAARAQEVPEEQYAVPAFPKNEIGLSLSLGTDLQAAALAGSMLVSFIGTIIKNDVFAVIPIFVPLNLEYYRWTSEKLAFGASLGTDTVSALPYVLASNISLMPEVKYKFLDTNGFSMYSKAGLGFKYLFLGVQDGDKLRFEWDYPASMLGEIRDVDLFDLGNLYARYVFLSPIAFQLSPLCFEIETAAKNLSVGIELGYGVQGVVNVGLKKTF